MPSFESRESKHDIHPIFIERWWENAFRQKEISEFAFEGIFKNERVVK